MFAYELLAFYEVTEVFSKSKSITLPNISGLYGLLIEQLNSLIFLANSSSPRSHMGKNEQQPSKDTMTCIHSDEGEIDKI